MECENTQPSEERSDVDGLVPELMTDVAPYRPLSEDEYFAELAGLADAEIIERWLGAGHPAAAQVLEGRTRLVGERVRGKPDPEGYLRALELLRIQPGEAVAVEDTPPGVAAAKGAGLYCVGVLGTVSPELLHEADEIAAEVDEALVERLLAL
jgi:beta-phosphoglucomutase-like phosphatase (HAD superfamily)